MCKDTTEFLKAYDRVAECLRSMKALALEVQGRGDIYAEVPADRMWTPGFSEAHLAAQQVPTPRGSQQVAAEILKRLRLWEATAIRAREMTAKGETPAMELHVQEIWEGADEQALARWEELRARLLGAQPLPLLEVS